jgi:2-keto-4-pentenoate hydratase/2-oxohepta-3-ene-1,7-dioic acid hydratase in catechol pathway
MKICRFQHADSVRYGLIEEVAGTSTITRTLDRFPSGTSDFGSAQASNIPLNAARLLAPTQPSKIVCVGRNYREHAKELNSEIPTSPLIFLKPPSAVVAHGDEVRRPHRLSQRVDHEGELGVVIGRRCHDLRDDEDVRPYIMGYTCVNDVTARDLQNIDGQWTRAKGFDTFCPIGPVIADGLDPWKGVRIETQLNGQVRQSGTTADFIFPLDVILRYITSVMTLEPGDVIATGTPAGVGPMQAGDVVEVTVEGVGSLRNPIVNA